MDDGRDRCLRGLGDGDHQVDVGEQVRGYRAGGAVGDGQGLSNTPRRAEPVQIDGLDVREVVSAVGDDFGQVVLVREVDGQGKHSVAVDGVHRDLPEVEHLAERHGDDSGHEPGSPVVVRSHGVGHARVESHLDVTGRVPPARQPVFGHRQAHGPVDPLGVALLDVTGQGVDRRIGEQVSHVDGAGEGGVEFLEQQH